MPDSTERSVLKALLVRVIGEERASDLAEALLEQYGSLTTLLETLPANKTPLLSETLTDLLSMVPQLLQRRLLENIGPHPLLDSLTSAAGYASTLYVGAQYEQVCLLCLNRDFRLIECCRFGEGSLREVPFYPRRLLQEAMRLHAHAVILCHNHPTGWGFFSESDVSATRELLTLCTQIALPLFDHLLIANGRCSSMRCRSFIPEKTWTDCSPLMPPVAKWRGARETGSFVMLPEQKMI